MCPARLARQDDGRRLRGPRHEWYVRRSNNQRLIGVIIFGPLQDLVPVATFAIDQEIRERKWLGFNPIKRHHFNVGMTHCNLSQRVDAMI